MNGFELRKERKRESIRHAAMELFGTYGFGKVSIKDIARKAGVSHVTIYNHFNSKEELVNDVVRTEIERLVEKSREIIDSESDFLEKMNLIRFSKVGLASRYNGEVMKAAINNSPETYEYIDKLWREKINKLLVELIEEGRRKGYISSDISQEAMLLYFDMIRAGAFASVETLDRIKIDAKLADDLNRLFLYGLIDKKD
ncbi:MAG TPA: TetR/AcrR family transcriptional regulator [Dehalococcoidia bacterium]|nr:TetR/AcrR family transcriptional regulator [Dehalococcoidia bacterium]